jgi:hypothetical protein
MGGALRNLLSIKSFHEGLPGNPHIYSLKSGIGKVRLVGSDELSCSFGLPGVNDMGAFPE